MHTPGWRKTHTLCESQGISIISQCGEWFHGPYIFPIHLTGAIHLAFLHTQLRQPISHTCQSVCTLQSPSMWMEGPSVCLNGDCTQRSCATAGTFHDFSALLYTGTRQGSCICHRGGVQDALWQRVQDTIQIVHGTPRRLQCKYRCVLCRAE